ncbi:MAG: tRNA (cytidine(34)-2'-O)-methyltransferase [Phycisphaerales bacterium]|nr:tRNA (cytidine(34)-2'-O)-methyltransferase [Phycisphaerales bacterium]
MPAHEPTFHLALWQPQIPNNTGNIGRTAMATGCRLHVIHPIGFDMSEKACRRAGMDYWKEVDCHQHASWEQYLSEAAPRRIWLFSARATRTVWQARFERDDHLLFGREEDGIAPEIEAWVRREQGDERVVGLPMVAHPGARSLNLATAVACAVYEGLRQVVDATGRLPAAYDR